MDAQLTTGQFGPITQTDIVRFAGAGGDFNPLHHDPAFAKRAGFDTPIAMGQFTVALMSAWLTDQIGVENLLHLDVDFRAPVKIGDIVQFSQAPQDTDTGHDGVQSTKSMTSTSAGVATVTLLATVDGNRVASGQASFAQPNAAVNKDAKFEHHLEG